MEVKKATGVLAEMIKNINIEELVKIREQMMDVTNNPINVWLDKESRAYMNMRKKHGITDPVYLGEIENAAYMGLMTGYNKAMEIIQNWILENVEDTEINWVEVYHQINNNVTTHID